MSDPMKSLKDNITAKQQPPISFEFMLVSPSDAKELLGKNAHNRALSDKVVTRYANDITAGRWSLTHQPIAVGPDAELVDGQHRLAAIIKADQSVNIVLAIYRDARTAEEARMKVDLGRVRTGGDVFELGGVAEKGTGKRVYSIVTAMVQFEGPQPWGGWTPALIRARYDRERAGVDFSAAMPAKAFTAPIAAAFAYAFPVADQEVREFARIVIEKVGYEENTAAHHFVKAASDRQFAAGGDGKNRTERSDVSLRVLRLIQAHIEKEVMAKLQISPKGFEFFKSRREAMGIK